MKRSHSYKEALKKQYSVVILAFIIIAGLPLLIGPIDTPYKIFVYCIVVILIGVYTLWYVRQAGYKVSCVGCNNDIYSFIEMGRVSNKTVNYCPICGQKLGI